MITSLLPICDFQYNLLNNYFLFGSSLFLPASGDESDVDKKKTEDWDYSIIYSFTFVPTSSLFFINKSDSTNAISY